MKVTAVLLLWAAGAGAADAGTQHSRWEFRFASDSRRADRDLFLDAVAYAGPDARRLLHRVDRRVDVSFGALRPGVAGLTTRREGGRYSIRITRWVMQHRNPEAPRYVTLHELGHVVDLALIPDGTRNSLAATTRCPPDVGNCNRSEKFADGFANWAELSGDHTGRSTATQRALLQRWTRALRPFA